jgi:predicted N-formylglutamate amidohydrolase
MHRNDMMAHPALSTSSGQPQRRRGTHANMPPKDFFLVTCEHGGNRIPPRYRDLFNGGEALLHTHRGYDAGASTFARELADILDAPSYISCTSRLLIDLNRSIGHPRLYSEFTRNTPASLRREILQRYYLPYRSKVESHIAQIIARGYRVIHLSSHSFTPELGGNIRNTDVGLLYDPARAAESDFCRRWQAALRTQASALKVRLNYPYSGTADGFTVHLRRRFPADLLYVGIEIEINQKHVNQSGRHWRAIRATLLDGLRGALAPTVSEKQAAYG